VRRPQKPRKVAQGKQLHHPGGSALTTSDPGVVCSAQGTHNHEKKKRCRSESLVSRGRLGIGQGTGLPKSFAIANTKQEQNATRGGSMTPKDFRKKAGTRTQKVEG
jgi:hypothetical protein